MLNTYSAILHPTPLQTNGFYWSISYWMVIFDFNCDIKLALTVTIFDEIYSQTWPWSSFGIALTTSLYLLCYVMKLAGTICKLDRFLENLQIVQCKLAGLADWKEQIYSHSQSTPPQSNNICIVCSQLSMTSGSNDARRLKGASSTDACFRCGQKGHYASACRESTRYHRATTRISAQSSTPSTFRRRWSGQR